METTRGSLKSQGSLGCDHEHKVLDHLVVGKEPTLAKGATNAPEAPSTRGRESMLKTVTNEGILSSNTVDRDEMASFGFILVQQV